MNDAKGPVSSPLWAAPLAVAGSAGCETQEQSWSSQEHFDRELYKKNIS